MRSKKLLSVLAGVCALGLFLFTSGCITPDANTTPEPVAVKYAPLLYSVTYTGTVIHLRDNEQDLAAFQQVKVGLDALLASEKIDAYAISRVLASLPVKELKGDNAQLILSATSSLLVAYQDQVLPPETKALMEFTASEVRVVASAIRDGLSDGILQATLSPASDSGGGS